MPLQTWSMRPSALLWMALFISLGSAGGEVQAADTVRVSVDNAGAEGNLASRTPEFNTDGRFVAFISRASDLVAGDTNNELDVFVYDRQAKTIERVSVSSLGAEGNGPSGAAASASCLRAETSGNGRWIAFESNADNLVAGDTNNLTDVFVHDRLTGQTERVSLDSAGGQLTGFSTSPAISRDGRFAAFVSASVVVPEDGNDSFDVFVRDRVAGTTERVSVGSGGIEGNDLSGCPSLSADGRLVAFQSLASNLVAGDTNDANDVFVHDRSSHTTQRVSVNGTGDEADAGGATPRISGDGRMVAFASAATNLVSADTNESTDIFVRDLQTGATTRVSTAVNGAQASGGASGMPDIDDAGRHAVFVSASPDLVADDTNEAGDVFVKDLLTGMIRRVSLAHDGGQMQGAIAGLSGAISGNGRLAGFESSASNLVANDTNEVEDVFVRDLPTFPYEYAAKIVCGSQTDAAELRLARGLYTTTVNIHSSIEGIELFKKLVLTIPPQDQQPGEIFPIAQHVLAYDQALAVTCENLRHEVFNDEFPASFIEGFLVVQSTGSLDVTAVYSTAAIDAHGVAGDHSSIHVMAVPERRKSPKLSVTKSGQYFCNALPIETECTVVAALYTVTVRNDGTVPAENVVLDDVVARSDGLPLVLALAGPHEVPATAVFSVTGPGSIRVEMPELAPSEEAQVRFWALAVVGPGHEPDVLINRVNVSADNTSETANVVVQQGFD